MVSLILSQKNIFKHSLMKFDNCTLDFIWDFGKLPIPLHLGNFVILFWEKIPNIDKIGKIKTIFGLGMTPPNPSGGPKVSLKT